MAPGLAEEEEKSRGLELGVIGKASGLFTALFLGRNTNVPSPAGGERKGLDWAAAVKRGVGSA